MIVREVLEALRAFIVMAIFGRVILSFFPRIDSSHPVVRFIHTVTEPILAPFRNILPTASIGIDFSPLLAIFVIDMLFRLLMSLFSSSL